MRKLHQESMGSAVQARGVAGAASARSELVVLQHRFASDHPRFARRHPQFTARSVGGSAVSHVHPSAEVAVRLRQQHNAPVSLDESSACQRTVSMSHAPRHRRPVASAVRGLAASAAVSRKAVVLASFHQRSNPSIEGTSSGMLRMPPAAPHVER